MKKFLFLTLIFSFSLCAHERDAALLSIGTGVFNIVKPKKKPEFQIEYIPSFGYYNTYPFVLRSVFGIMMNTDRGTYTYSGARLDMFATRHFVVTPSFSGGIYTKGKGKKLHSPVEFRSSIEVAYRFNSKARLGAQFYHISNAGLGKKNPGTECLVFFIAIPFG